MTDILYFESAQARALFDAVPSMVFLIDEEYRVRDANVAAVRVLGENPERMFKRLCGDILRCLHAQESPDSCGSTPFCKDCVVRSTVESAIQGQKMQRRRNRMRIREGEQEKDVVFLITAAPFTYCDDRLAIVIVEDISELMELRKIVPICVKCKKIRDDVDFWHDVELYMKKHMDIDCSHGVCQTCMKQLYPEFSQ